MKDVLISNVHVLNIGVLYFVKRPAQIIHIIIKNHLHLYHTFIITDFFFLALIIITITFIVIKNPPFSFSKLKPHIWYVSHNVDTKVKLWFHSNVGSNFIFLSPENSFTQSLSFPVLKRKLNFNKRVNFYAMHDKILSSWDFVFGDAMLQLVLWPQ